MEDINIQWHLGLKSDVDLELVKETPRLIYFKDYSLNQ